MKCRVVCLGLVCLVSIAGAAHAQGYPTRPVTLVVPFPPGGGTDTGARIVAQRLGQRWGRAVIIDNKGGAAGSIGAEYAAKARPDGYTLMMGNIGTQSINPSLYPRLSYDPDKAFVPISLVAELPLVMLVNPDVPAKTVKEFIALAKSQPGRFSYSTSGAGSSMHLAGEMFKNQSRTFILHVPYRGGGPAIGDLLARHVQLTFATALEASGHIRSGKLRALAVTGATRVPSLPDVPTLSEAGLPGFNSISWIGLLAPAGTPKGIVDKIAADLREVLGSGDGRQMLIELGAVPAPGTPAQFAALITNDRKRYERIIRERAITAD